MAQHDQTELDSALRVKAILSILQEKKLIRMDALDAVVDADGHKFGPRNGAKVVARAWADPEYKKRLLSDGTKAIAELGFSGAQGENMVVVENTRKVHNLGRLHAVLLLSLAHLGIAPDLV